MSSWKTPCRICTNAPRKHGAPICIPFEDTATNEVPCLITVTLSLACAPHWLDVAAACVSPSKTTFAISPDTVSTVPKYTSGFDFIFSDSLLTFSARIDKAFLISSNKSPPPIFDGATRLEGYILIYGRIVAHVHDPEHVPQIRAVVQMLHFHRFNERQRPQ